MSPPHLKYVATLPFVIYRQRLVLLTLMFHEVMQQHMQGVVGFLIWI